MPLISALPPLKIGTFNIRWANPGDGPHRWEFRKPRLMEMLHRWEPDVLGLQEALRSPLAEIRQALPLYDFVGVGRENGAEEGEFCPIFYRKTRLRLVDSGTFWFSDTPEKPASRSWGNRTTRICTWAQLTDRETGAAFDVYNLHLDHESQPSREKSVDFLLSRIRGRQKQAPVIVMGDFNAETENPAIVRINSPDSPVATSVLTGFPSQRPGTFHGFTGETSGSPIDHIFVSPEWEVIYAQIIRGDGTRPFVSDHFPIAATLSLREAR